jgi:hypothetical protein
LSGIDRRDAEDAEQAKGLKTKKLASGFLFELCDSAVRRHFFINLLGLGRPPLGDFDGRVPGRQPKRGQFFPREARRGYSTGGDLS